MVCAKCNKEFPNYMFVNGKVRNLHRRKFCLECSPFGAHNTCSVLTEPRMCLHCGMKLIKRQKLFCDNICQGEYYYREYIQRWKAGLENGTTGKYQTSKRIRKYLLEKYDNKCSQCGWGKVNPFTQNIPLEVHHKDGNYLNNDEENLDLLCPNCHSLTSTYKNRNTKYGRKDRKKYY